MFVAVYFLCLCAAFFVFFRFGRRLAEPYWNRYRNMLGVLIGICAFAAAVLWPFTGILAILVWLVGLAVRPPGARRPAGRRVLPGLAASGLFVIGLVAFVALTPQAPVEPGPPRDSAKVVDSAAPTTGQAPRPVPAPVVPVAPRPAVAAPSVAPVVPVVGAPGTRMPASRPVGPPSPAATYQQAPRVVAAAPDTAPTSGTACGADYYRNSDGLCVHRPEQAAGAPAGATAQCADGTYSFSTHRQGTCSHHGGVARWL